MIINAVNGSGKMLIIDPNPENCKIVEFFVSSYERSIGTINKKAADKIITALNKGCSNKKSGGLAFIYSRNGQKQFLTIYPTNRKRNKLNSITVDLNEFLLKFEEYIKDLTI